MEDAEGVHDTVHPQVRAHITSLVSALGGFSIDDDHGGYKLGDDALEVLRDLKKWIRFYDEKTNRMDVARCLAEANLVGSDLLHILATWPPNDNSNNKYKAKIALACLELMVPLTWPIERDRETMTVNHYRHMPVLQLAQVGYKRAIINFDAAPILATAVRVALPSMAVPNGDRTARDQGIIKLVLYFLRNIAMITPPPGLQYDGDETQISRSALIDAFSFQDIFLALLTIASNMGDDFRTEDVIVMDILFHLVKRVDSSKLFVSEQRLHKLKADELTAARQKEAAMLRASRKNAPTRHSRFGTMIWVKREGGKLATVSGQDALLDAAARERKMDSTKTFKPPRRPRREDMEPKDLGPPVTLDERARQQLRSFVSDFLDAGFNPLFGHVRKSLDREAPHVLHYHHGQFFYLVAWFLQAERMRRKAQKGSKQPAGPDDVSSFNLIAAVLSQEMFIAMNRALERAYGDKDWQLLTTVMRCFTQILLTVQEMWESQNEDDHDIADNILSRLFYEEATHDAIANIVRTYKDQGFEYLDACTELAHYFLRILEGYSKQNVDLQVRSRKRRRRKRKAVRAAKAAAGEEGADDDDPGDVDDDSADDERQAEKTSQERRFDFKRFATRFTPQGVVDTFVAFTKYYRDLDDAQLKRAHRYFHQVAFKQEMSVMLFRLDILHLFYNMIKGPEPLDNSSPAYKEWHDLTKYIIRRCIHKLEERPALFTELLFSKINSTAHYLEYGYEKQTMASHPRPAAELEFKHEAERDRQIAIVVGVLLDRNQTDHLEWFKKQLSEAESERRAWEKAEEALAAERLAEGAATGDAAAEPGANTERTAPHATLRPDNDARRTAIFKNPHLRLLMKLAGAERLAPSLDESPDSIWVIPGTITADVIQETLAHIHQAEFTPPTFQDGELAEDQLRRKAAPRKPRASRNDNDDDDDDDGNQDLRGFLDHSDEEDDGAAGILFPKGGPTVRKRTAEDEPPKKRGARRRRKRSDSQEPDDALADEKAEARRRARRKRELEKARKIKSAVYVDPRDDESDEERDAEFFARELARQEAKNASYGLGGGEAAMPSGIERSAWEELLGGGDGDEEEGEEEAVAAAASRGRKRKSGGAARAVSSEDEDQDNDDDEEEDEESASGSDGGSDSSATADSGSEERPNKRRRRILTTQKKRVVEEEEEEEEEDDEDGQMDLDRPQESSFWTAQSNKETNDAPLPIGSGGIAGEKKATEAHGEDNDDDDDMPVAKPTKARPKARAGFILEDSDEE
ncbi:hypothetical protein VTJ83DRAFT_5842 [Remersonia thermophila]|uniref:Topoisomerase 1-associated factor 1 n=1 Tax=Remersonia thermophila TaxID=72144 RepID=A0ABR4D8R8_9PEZI